MAVRAEIRTDPNERSQSAVLFIDDEELGTITRGDDETEADLVRYANLTVWAIERTIERITAPPPRVTKTDAAGVP